MGGSNGARMGSPTGLSAQRLTVAKTAFHLFLMLLNLVLLRASPDVSFVEGRLGTDALPSFSNRVPGGGSSGIRDSGDRVTGIGGGSRIVFSFTFSPADVGVVVIRMTICLMLFRLVLVFRDLTLPGFPPNSASVSSDEGGDGGFSSIAVRE